MWKDKVLSSLTTEELKEFRILLTTNMTGRDQFLEKINERIISRQEKSKVITQEFRSDRLPYYDIEKKQVVGKAIKNLNIIPRLLKKYTKITVNYISSLFILIYYIYKK